MTAGFRERLLGDPSFPVKVAIECGIGVVTKVRTVATQPSLLARKPPFNQGSRTQRPIEITHTAGRKVTGTARARAQEAGKGHAKHSWLAGRKVIRRLYVAYDQADKLLNPQRSFEHGRFLQPHLSVSSA